MATTKKESPKSIKYSFDQNDISGLVGKHLVYKYDNGWQYEIYMKNAKTLDYRIHSGPYGNRWVKHQRAFIVRIGVCTFKTSWTEPTGTDVSLVINLAEPFVHGTIFFPRWVADNPGKTTLFQNEVITRMEEYREAGPAYPTEVINAFATIIHIGDPGPDDDNVIACGPKDLPDGFLRDLRRIKMSST